MCYKTRTQRRQTRKGGLNLVPYAKELRRPSHWRPVHQLQENRTDPDPVPSTAGPDDDELDQTEADPNIWFAFGNYEAANSAVVFYDRAIKWFDDFPNATRSEARIVEAMQVFTKPFDQNYHVRQRQRTHIPGRKQGWRQPTFTPDTPQTNGLAERCVRKVKQGGTALHRSSKAGTTRCPLVETHHEILMCITHHCHHRLQSRIKQAARKRALPLLVVPFGALVDLRAQPETKREHFESKAMQGLFAGYHLLPGGIRSGDLSICGVRDVPEGHRRRPVSTRQGKYTSEEGSLRTV